MQVLVSISVFFDFHYVACRDCKVQYSVGSLFCKSSVLAGIGGSVCITKVPENFVGNILQNGFWFGHLPFGSMVKFKFFAQFPVDHLLHPVVSSLELLQY